MDPWKQTRPAGVEYRAIANSTPSLRENRVVKRTSKAPPRTFFDDTM